MSPNTSCMLQAVLRLFHTLTKTTQSLYIFFGSHNIYISIVDIIKKYYSQIHIPIQTTSTTNCQIFLSTCHQAVPPKSAKLGKAIKPIYCRTVPPKKTVQDVQSIQMILTNLKHDELKRHTFPVPQVPSLYNKWAFSPDLATSYWGIGYGSISLLRLDDGNTQDMGIFKLSMSKSFQIDGYLYAMLLCSIRMSINFEPSPGQVNDLSAMMQCPQRKGDGGRISVTPMWKTQINSSKSEIQLYIYVIIAVICENILKAGTFHLIHESFLADIRP